MVGKKYVRFTNWLLSSHKNEVQLSFEELNRIISIPDAAFRHRSYWANPSNPQSFQAGWINAGYVVESVSLDDRMVVFRKEAGKTAAALQPELESRQDLISYGYACYDSMASTPHHRYRSWEHCHSVFLDAHRQCRPDLDYLCLHLAWYLASWGMLRNSFLMQHDYKLHVPVVKLLLSQEWDELWDLPAEKMSQTIYAEKIQCLYSAIEKLYLKETGSVPTDTLITKILLGTLACVPAYDKYFKSAMASTGIASRTFGVKSILQLGQEYLNHFEDYNDLSDYCSKNMNYPAAKVLDMVFFEYGYQSSRHEEESI